MIGECEAVFAAWASASDADERHKKTGELQAGCEKFGDPDLYFALAKNGQAIWNSQAGAEILKQWVKRRQAEWDEKRWKIPRFCHPDPFHHPTWCEFGGSSKPAVWYAWRSDAKPMNPEPGGDADGTRRFRLLLPDFSAARARPAPMRWECKRLSRHFGEAQRVTEKPIPPQTEWVWLRQVFRCGMKTAIACIIVPNTHLQTTPRAGTPVCKRIAKL